ncbi:MAG: hypothetical protein ABIA63_04740 [bacterium]
MAGIEPIGPYHISSLAMPLSAQAGIKGEPAPAIIPEGIEIRRRIARNYGVEVLDSDVKFSGAECAAIEETLKEIKKKKEKHLIGVRQVIKNREHKIRLLKSAQIHAGGAYDAENKRVFLFDSITEKDIPEVLIHEIGHAVSYFNLQFTQFMDFVKDSGYNMVEFRKYYVPGNQYHQIGMKKIKLPKEDWGKVLERFSMKSLAKSEDVFGEIVLEYGKRKRFPWDENPLEKFAWAYEWFVSRPKEFARMAQNAAEHGDETWLADFDFLKDTVFEEGEENGLQAA